MSELQTTTFQIGDQFDIDPDTIVHTVSHAGGIKVYYVTDEEYICGAQTADGGTCQVSVESPDARCYHHKE